MEYTNSTSATNFIIAGTEKAGTTSVFTGLSKHPDVVASRRKETNFFRQPGGSLAAYIQHFPSAPVNSTVLMEASPAYLGEARNVAPRIAELIPDAKLLFILREPGERLYSSFNFHKSHLNLPASLTFETYVEKCMDYHWSKCTQTSDVQGNDEYLNEWQLSVLNFGCYATHLQKYFACFSADQIKVGFYDELCEHPERFMKDICLFVGIDPAPVTEGELRKVNATFSSRLQVLHKLALWTNDRLEPILRANPALKMKVASIYKSFNQRREGYDPMTMQNRQRLSEFYAPYNCKLKELLKTELPSSWHGTPDS